MIDGLRPAGFAFALAGLVTTLSGCTVLPTRPGKDGVTVSPSSPNAGTIASTTEAEGKAIATQGALRPTEDQQVHMHLDLARVHDEQGELDKAVEQYQKAVDLYAAQGPRRGFGDAKVRARLQRRLGTACDRLGRFADAEVHYQAAIKLTPRDALAWNDAGYSQYLQGRWDTAEQRLRKAVALDPANHKFRTNLGLILAADGRVDDALLVFEQAGGKANAHVNVGYILAAQGDVDSARQHYRAALDLQPNLDQATRALAKLDAGIPKKDDATQLAGAVKEKTSK